MAEVAEEVVVVVVAVVMHMTLVVHGLHKRHWVRLHYRYWHLHEFHNWHLDDLLNRHGVVDGHFDNLLVRHLHDFFNGVWNRPIDFHVLDLDDWHWHLTDYWNLDWVGVRDGYFDGVGHWHRNGFGHLVGHFTKYLVGLLADTVLSSSSVGVSESMNLSNDRSFRSFRNKITYWSRRSSKSAIETSRTS